MKLNLMNFFTKTLKILLYIQPFILKYGFNRDSKIYIYIYVGLIVILL